MAESRKQASHPAQKRYPPELGERATRMVLEIFESGERHGVVGRVARQLGIGIESLRNWVHQAEIDSGVPAGVDGRSAADGGAGEGEPGAAPGQRDPQVGIGVLAGRSSTAG